MATRTAQSTVVYGLGYQDWLQFPDEPKIYEILEGDFYMTPPPNIRHQELQKRLGKHLQDMEDRGLGFVFYAPTGVLLAEDIVVEPDLFFIIRERSEIIKTQAVEGPPDLVVEILSPATSHKDRTIKLNLYSHHGVREYWIVDPVTEKVEVFSRHQDRLALRSTLDTTGTLISPLLPDLDIQLADVFRRGR